ncbi:MAG: anthranilate synthase component I [Acholeplasmatales bacterium]|nr:anthranilate synthase component I [Acholeplasmatales bacterium]
MKPSFEEVKELKGFSVIPVSVEIMSDIKTPIQVLKNLKAISKKHYLLESVTNEKLGRYSFLGYDPILEIKCKDNLVTITKDDKIESFESKNPLDEVRKIIKEYKSPYFDYLPSFTGGFVGYASYDTIKYKEPVLKFSSYDEAKFDDYNFMLFDKVIAFDNIRQRIILIVNIKTDNLEENYKKAKKELEKLITLVKADFHPSIPNNKIIEPIKANDTFEDYSKKIDKIKNYIKDGDIFQCVFSRRFKGKMKGDLFNTYRILRGLNPSPYMIFMDTGDIQISGASPETLVKKEGKNVVTFPIAGTRPRGKDEKEDLIFENELKNDEKELAEHNMLVDLGRNDIGRIAKFGSVEVLQYQYILKFSHVMHITSTVNGIISDDCDAIDTLQSLLPAGTLSGAPKIRACQIIDELEPVRRGIYGGAIGYIDFRGNLDMCICIRCAIKKGDDVYVQAGGGIVLDSVAENEYQETENKAKAVLKAIQMSEGELE